MTRSSLQGRSALYGKRGFHLGRAVPALLEPPVPPDITPTPNKPNTPDTPPVPAKDKNTPTTAALIPSILSGILSPDPSKLSSSTTSTTSTTSTSSVSTTTSSATTSSPPTTKAPTTTSTTPHVVVHTATSVSSLTPTQSQTPSETAQVSTGISAITVISGIGGALIATILLTVVIGFFLRRWRRNRSAENAFGASQFRRSGVLLNENDDNIPDRPRPPSMIERRNATTPPAAYPHSDEPPLSTNEHAQSFAQYGANQAQYGAIPQHPSFAARNQFGGNGGAPAMYYDADPYAMDYRQGAYSGPGEQPGYGAPPVPGIHGPGAYAPYGVDSRYPQSQRYPHPKEYQNQQPQQHGFGNGPAIDTLTSSTRDENVPNLANPFSPLRVFKKLESTENSGPESLSTPPTLPSSTPPPSSNPGTTPFVTRQSREALPTYTNNGGYADVQRDVKMSPALLNVVNGSSDAAVPPTDNTTMTESNGGVPEPPRPLTVYGDDDVYGGM